MAASELDDPVLLSRVGKTLNGKYRLDRLLGVGGMATVYAATHRNRRRFAIKVLHAELSLRDDLRSRFVREGYVANTVEHPGVVSVIDDDMTEDGLAFIVMELLEGKSLEGLWCENDEKLPVPLVLVLARQVLEVLGAAHQRGIVHRDVKPDNLFVTDDGRVKVLDFGIARLRSEAATSPKLTATGTTLGTPAFMAPEQVLGDVAQVDARSDLWSVGATLFVLISGKLVHDGSTPQKLMIQAATQPARPLASVASEVPAAVLAVVDRALSFAKADRYATAEEMAHALDRAHHEAFARPLDATPTSITRQVRELRSEARAVLRRSASADAAASDRVSSPEAAHAVDGRSGEAPRRHAAKASDVSDAGRRSAGNEADAGPASQAGGASEAARSAPLPPGSCDAEPEAGHRASERSAHPGIVATPAGVAAAHVHVNIGSAHDSGAARFGWVIALVTLAALVAFLAFSRQGEHAGQRPIPEPRPAAAAPAPEGATPQSTISHRTSGASTPSVAAVEVRSEVPDEVRGEAPDEPREAAVLQAAGSTQMQAGSEAEKGITSRERGRTAPPRGAAPRATAPAPLTAPWAGCSRLLERQSLGMKLTDAEKSQLARLCRK